MLARYPKLEAATHIRGSASDSTSAATCPILPRLCIGGHNDNASNSDDREKTRGGGDGSSSVVVAAEEVADWSPDRGCDSAPVVAEDRRDSSRFFVLGDQIHRHLRHYPRCHRRDQRILLQDDDSKWAPPPAPKDSKGKQGSAARKLSPDVEVGSLQLPSAEGVAARTGDSAETPATTFRGSAVVIPSGDPDASIMDVSPEEDFKRLSRCVDLLHNSGYYYEGLSWQQATLKLRKCKVGTFLVRESENANFLFTLSVQTKKGPTSVRIAYKGGRFRLDSDEDLVSRMPTFDTVTDLVEHYVRVSKESLSHKIVSCCWLDLAGECSAPVELYYPLYKQVHSLKHLCRLRVVNQVKKFSPNSPLEWTLESSRNLCLPMALKEYIKEYPLGH